MRDISGSADRDGSARTADRGRRPPDRSTTKETGSHADALQLLASSHHGWLIVTPDELAAVGLSEADITPYSYRRGDQLGLEEDEDAQTFLAAYKARFGREAEIIDDLGSCGQWEHFGKQPCH